MHSHNMSATARARDAAREGRTFAVRGDGAVDDVGRVVLEDERRLQLVRSRRGHPRVCGRAPQSSLVTKCTCTTRASDAIIRGPGPLHTDPDGPVSRLPCGQRAEGQREVRWGVSPSPTAPRLPRLCTAQSANNKSPLRFHITTERFFAKRIEVN